MSLTYAILTSLMEAPSTGADLVRRFDKSIGYFWNCTHQQIYRDLKELVAEGWVSSEPSKDKPGSQVYAIEARGREALAAWLLNERNDPAVRDPFLVKVRAMASFGELDAAQLFREKQRYHAERLALYENIHRKSFLAPKDKAQLLQSMVLDAGMRRERAQLEWCEACLKQLAELPS